MLNSIGLANPGRDRFLAENLPRLRELGVPLWISVGGFSAHEYAETCAQLEDVTVELNLSCPNVEEARPHGRRDRRRLPGRDHAAALREALTGQLGRRRGGPRRGRAGADGLSLVNTIRGLKLDERSLSPTLGPALGGYSGPALKPIALAAVYSCRRAVDLPIVGMGGIRTGRDVLEFVAAGANDVALGTVLFADPNAPARIRNELAAEVAALGYSRRGRIARDRSSAESPSTQR